jgi:hypothetical protein
MNIFCGITPCGSSKNGRFVGTYHFDLQGDRTLGFSYLSARTCPTADGEGTSYNSTATIAYGYENSYKTKITAFKSSRSFAAKASSMLQIA